MSTQWYFVSNNERYGPLPAAALAQYLQDGRITAETLVWRQGMNDWEPLARRHEEIAGSVPPPAAEDAAGASAAGGSTSLADLTADLGGRDMRLDVMSEQGSSNFDIGESISKKYPPVGGMGGGAGGAVAITDYAGFFQRFIAVIIDGIITGVLGVLIGLILGIALAAAGQAEAVASGQYDAIFNAIGALVGLNYYAYFESSAMQATPGKKLLGLAVTGVDGNRIGFFRAFGRNLGKYLSLLILMIGFLMQPFTPRKQALHDMMAGCLVLRVS